MLTISIYTVFWRTNLRVYRGIRVYSIKRILFVQFTRISFIAFCSDLNIIIKWTWKVDKNNFNWLIKKNLWLIFVALLSIISHVLYYLIEYLYYTLQNTLIWWLEFENNIYLNDFCMEIYILIYFISLKF